MNKTWRNIHNNKKLIMISFQLNAPTMHLKHSVCRDIFPILKVLNKVPEISVLQTFLPHIRIISCWNILSASICTNKFSPTIEHILRFGYHSKRESLVFILVQQVTIHKLRSTIDIDHTRKTKILLTHLW
jgi:hypothetical protein